jgi:diaminopimelate epimerase
MKFFKYQGTGNDFVMVDNRDGNFAATQLQIEQLCDRRFGIGADGLITLTAAQDYDFRMIYYNADGQEGSMCGNGGRCAVRFAHDLGIIGESANFIAVDGPHVASVCDSDIYLKMQDVANIEQYSDFCFANTGSPHYVTFTDKIENVDVYNQGHQIRYSDYWQARGGVNVNFVQKNIDGSLAVRTYERGVEDETFSCGTGVTACVLAAYLQYGSSSPVTVKVLGGQLSVSFQYDQQLGFSNIYLNGPAKKVYEGQITL